VFSNEVEIFRQGIEAFAGRAVIHQELLAFRSRLGDTPQDKEKLGKSLSLDIGPKCGLTFNGLIQSDFLARDVQRLDVLAAQDVDVCQRAE